MNRIVRTVLRDIAPEELGRTDVHEHLLMASPLLAGDELDDVELSGAEAAGLREAGMDAVVELTPLGVGRDPEGVAAIARYSGLHIVLATGTHHEDHYPPGHWVWDASEEDLADRLVRDLTAGCATAEGEPEGPVRAGVLKVGTGYWRISPTERRFLSAVSAAQHRTGAAVVCHLERGSAAVETLDSLVALGVPAERVALAHIDRNPDPGLHCELAAAGAYLCYDGPGRVKDWPDSVLLDCMRQVVEAGHASKLLVGADVGRRSRFRAYGGLPGLDYLPRRFLPRMRSLLGATVTETVLVRNPSRLLAMPQHSAEKGRTTG